MTYAPYGSKTLGRRRFVGGPQGEVVYTFYHRNYLINLPEQSREDILAAFEGLLGSHTVIRAVGVQDAAGADEARLRDMIAFVNNRRARAAREARSPSWRRLKLILWRGCWCVTAKAGGR